MSTAMLAVPPHKVIAMPRQPRLDVAGVSQHVVQRGNDRQPCFFLEADYHRYLDELHAASLRYEVALHAYVLMTNHVHLLVTPGEPGAVSRMMQCLGRHYVGYVNRAYRRTGTLWEGRYKSCLVGGERYVLACHRYIELNPVRAAMVATPADYPWSSHRANTLDLEDARLTAHPVLLGLAALPEQRRAAYLALFAEVLEAQHILELRAYLQQQRAFGSDRFQAAIEAQLGRCAQVRPAHRPVKKKLL